MKVTAAASALLFANAALAAPGSAARRERAAKRATGSRQSNVMQPAEGEVENMAINGTTHVEYSSNWAGAVLIGTGYNMVTGTFTVPTPKSSGSGTASASAWVGIDGDTCGTAILQTGVDFTVSRSGAVSYDAWYEWYPDYAYDFSGISISAGDTITVTVDASSTSAGVATVENVSTGQTVTHSFSRESAELCEYNAEWIVEDFESGGALVNFADFDSVTFTDCSTNKGGVSGSTIIDIQQSGQVLTDCSTSGSSTVTCDYTG
ncbi:peptidase A4 family-domain-containing protein [Xylariomycetidae sp. FL0641]|nr:peptidase A4 family-domain-containing protein [Xylariomycetidae sp. FL0641]